MKYLLTHQEIRKAIHKVFSSDGDKWAVVGFVGYNALDQLPTGIKNLSVICWPKPGATSPDGIRRLINAGINVCFCDQLHSKIYWSSDSGLVIGSANLSENALGNSNQHEFAVYLSGNNFDISKVLSQLTYKPVDEQSLHALDVAHVASEARDPDCDRPIEQQLSFVDAHRLPSPKMWKLVTWGYKRKDNLYIKNAVIKNYGKNRWINNNDVKAGVFEKGDFVLQVHVDFDDNELIKRANSKWLRVDMLVTQSKMSSAIVQVEPLKDGATPPFMNDGKFNKIFKEICNNSSWEEIIDENSFVREQFIQQLLQKYT